MRSKSWSGSHPTQAGLSLLQLLVALSSLLIIQGMALRWYYNLMSQQQTLAKHYQQNVALRQTLLDLQILIETSAYLGPRSRDPYQAIRLQHPAHAKYLKPHSQALVRTLSLNSTNCLHYLPSSSCQKMVPKQTILLLSAVPKRSFALSKSMPSNERTLYLNQVAGREQAAQTFLISHGPHTEIFHGTYHGKSIQMPANGKLSLPYPKGSEISQLVDYALYLGYGKNRQAKTGKILFLDNLNKAGGGQARALLGNLQSCQFVLSPSPKSDQETLRSKDQVLTIKLQAQDSKQIYQQVYALRNVG